MNFTNLAFVAVGYYAITRRNKRVKEQRYEDTTGEIEEFHDTVEIQNNQNYKHHSWLDRAIHKNYMKYQKHNDGILRDAPHKFDLNKHPIKSLRKLSLGKKI